MICPNCGDENDGAIIQSEDNDAEFVDFCSGCGNTWNRRRLIDASLLKALLEAVCVYVSGDAEGIEQLIKRLSPNETVDAQDSYI